MRRVSSADFVRRFSALCDEALSDPVVMTRNGRDRLLVVSLDHYRHLLSLATIRSDDGSKDFKLAEELGFLAKTDDGRSAGR